jgi:TDG/mug DNA glycosylase family protein
VPLALADLHRTLAVGRHVTVRLSRQWLPRASVPISPIDVVTGAGFDVLASSGERSSITAVRARTLPDYVGKRMRMLVVGLNPSLYAADAGVGFARPGNRFWPAMRDAGLATCDRDPRHLLGVDRVGMTDLVKRATRGAAELAPAEYEAGLPRLERLIAWLEPGVVAVLGVTGWRHAVDHHAALGWQPSAIGGRPVYVMPNPSGANAHARPADLVRHLRVLAAVT